MHILAGLVWLISGMQKKYLIGRHLRSKGHHSQTAIINAKFTNLNQNFYEDC